MSLANPLRTKDENYREVGPSKFVDDAVTFHGMQRDRSIHNGERRHSDRWWRHITSALLRFRQQLFKSLAQSHDLLLCGWPFRLFKSAQLVALATQYLLQ